jgi:DNA-binding NarL/FixJ family response regulator
VAAEGPLVLVVDDIHWSDTGSLRFLAYLARRLEGLPVAMVLAYRSGEQHVLGGLIDELRQDAATVGVRPVPLTLGAVSEMISSRLGEEADEEFVAACFDGTTGNPLLVRQLLRALEAEGIRPDRAHADTARRLGSRAVSSVVLLRLRRLPPAATAVARALAILGEGAALPHVAELASIAEGPAAEVTALLVQAEIVRPEPPLAFVHPLVRDAVYGDVPPGERELLHEAAARILEGAGRSDEQIAAQLLLAPRRGNPWVVEVLRRAAKEAVRRGSSDGAVTFLTRALGEPAAAALRPQLQLELGLVETSTNGPAAGRDLQAAYDTLADDEARATAALALTRTLVFVGDFGSPVRFAERALAGLPERLAEERAAVLAYQRIAGQMHGIDPAVWRFAEEPEIPGKGSGSRMLQATVSYERMCRTAPRADAVEFAAASLSDGQLVNDDPGLLWVWSQVVLDLADEDVLPNWDAINAVAHQRGSLFSVLAVGFWRAWSLMRRGELAEAEQSIRTGLEQLDMWQRNATTQPYGRATLARILFDQDRGAEARVVAGPATEPLSAIDGDRLLSEVRAEMLLAEGRPREALQLLDTVVERSPQVTNPAWRRDRVLRCLAAGRSGSTAEAIADAEQLLVLAQRWGAPGAIGETLLLLGLLRGRDGVEELRQSVTVLAESPRRVLHADALVALAASMSPRAPETIAALHNAHRIGTATGAARIVRAVGDVVRRNSLPPPEEGIRAEAGLTSIERRIRSLIDAGATVHEVGQALFLTPSTVERHLASARRHRALPLQD